ncbi:MAG: FAD-binding oxidoreductase [Ignavibacteriota bacterium]
MIFFPQSYEDLTQYLRTRPKSPLRISSATEEKYDQDTISVAKLDSVLFYEPEEMILCAQAGIKISELEKILCQRNQWLPTLPSQETDELTLGAAVSNDSYHLRSLSCGALRTTILGGTFCTTDGEIFTSGSRVVKSVAGYDIHRAFSRSRGRFGIILDLTLKVQPLPEIYFRCLAPLRSEKRLTEFHPTVSEQIEEMLLIELAGYTEDIEADIEAIKTYGIPIEVLDEKRWKDLSLKAIALKKQDRGENSEASLLLEKLRTVFDPGGVLIS